MILLQTGYEDYMLPCFTKKMIGIDCMGCGLQRSFVFLLKGKLIEAFLMYPAIYPMIFLFVFIIFDCFYKINNGEKIKLGLAILTLFTVVTSYIFKLFIN